MGYTIDNKFDRKINERMVFPMKKMLAMLLAVLTLCFGAAAMAESVPEADAAAEQAALTDLTAEEAQPGLAEVYPTATVQDLNGTSVVAFHDAEEDVLGVVVMDTVDAGYYIFMFTPASDEAFLPVADAIAASFTAAQ